MKSYKAPRLLGSLLRAASVCVLVVAGASAVRADDNQYEFSIDRSSVTFDVKHAPRREVLEGLFAGSGVEIKWVDAAFAAEPIDGKFTGALADVLRQLLVRTNFVIVYDRAEEASRVVRLVIVGRAQGDQLPSTPTAVSAAITQAKEQRVNAEAANRNGRQVALNAVSRPERAVATASATTVPETASAATSAPKTPSSDPGSGNVTIVAADAGRGPSPFPGPSSGSAPAIAGPLSGGSPGPVPTVTEGSAPPPRLPPTQPPLVSLPVTGRPAPSPAPFAQP